MRVLAGACILRPQVASRMTNGPKDQQEQLPN